MGKNISIRLTSPEDTEFERQHRASGEGPSTFAKRLLEQALKDQRQTEELKHRLETLESKVDSSNEDLRRLGAAILIAIGSIGTDQKLTSEEAREWLRIKELHS